MAAPQNDGPLDFFAFPDISKIASQEQEAIFAGSEDFPSAEPDNINYTALFVDDHSILIMSHYGRVLLLDRQTLQCKAEVMPEGIEFTAHDELGNPTTEPEETYDYSSNIIHVMIVHDQLLLTTADGELRRYDLPV